MARLACCAALITLGINVMFAAPDASASEAYPARPIRFIVPFTPGGASDILSRTLGQKLTENWGQQVIVDNRAGAGGNIGAGMAAKAAPDGYTLLLGYVGTLAINPSLYRDIPFNTLRDFAPVTNLVSQPLVLALHPSVPARTVAELIALAKQKPGSLSYASVGIGSTQHLAGEVLKSMAGIDVVHVPYKGSAPGLADLLAGQVQLMFVGMAPGLPHVKRGKITALAVVGAKRASALPEVPTIGETVAGYEISSWNGVLVQAGTPQAIIKKLHASITGILQLPDVRPQLIGLGFEIIGDTPEQFAATIKADLAKWSKVVKSIGASAE
jgi:tripartite-type tricarboxylate transporter receptor subunit TctC